MAFPRRNLKALEQQIELNGAVVGNWTSEGTEEQLQSKSSEVTGSRLVSPWQVLPMAAGGLSPIWLIRCMTMPQLSDTGVAPMHGQTVCARAGIRNPDSSRIVHYLETTKK